MPPKNSEMCSRKGMKEHAVTSETSQFIIILNITGSDVDEANEGNVPLIDTNLNIDIEN